MYWDNTTGNVNWTQVALELLCSYSEMEATASVLLQEHHDAAQGCDPLQLIKNFLTIYFQLKIGSNIRQDLMYY